MVYVDKTLKCIDCGSSFDFGAAEQEFFATKGFTNEPKRCPACRAARKQQSSAWRGGRDSYGYQRQREMHSAICASCGKETQVPFEPRNGRPVYCTACYAALRR